MDLDEIRTFVTIARERSFSGAAVKLARSQPAISRRIELLESELGERLFERLRTGTLLTDAGSALLPYAEAMLANARDGAAAVRDLQTGDTGTVSLALVGTLANAGLTDVLRAFTRRFPKVRLALQTATSREVGELVRRGDATLGLRYLADDHPDLVSQTIAREALVVVARTGHRLANGRKHGPRALAGERWVAFPARRPRESMVDFLERRLIAAGIENHDIVPIDSLSAQKRLVEAGFGIALLAASGIEEELRLGTLAVIKVPALDASIPVTIVRRRNGYLGAAAQALLATIASGVKGEAVRRRRAKNHAAPKALVALPALPPPDRPGRPSLRRSGEDNRRHSRGS
jgi:DNA-binding transcriptional LysR family regulator